jgi:hypothetical protein
MGCRTDIICFGEAAREPVAYLFLTQRRAIIRNSTPFLYIQIQEGNG